MPIQHEPENVAKPSELKADANRLSTYRMGMDTTFGYLRVFLFRDEYIPEVITNLNIVSDELNEIHDFLMKYQRFFQIVDEKFGLKIISCSEVSKKTIGEIKTEINKLLVSLSQKQYPIVQAIWATLQEKWQILKENIAIYPTIPYLIDYSKLSDTDWRMIGVPGVHYRSRVFLSYPFRDDDPKEDENQKMIDNYVKPMFEQLGITPITLRCVLKKQELIDDKACELIRGCDGVVGFYTTGDSVENVEHEIAQNSNTIAICRERGPAAPSMRLSRLQINFERGKMGGLLIDITAALKDKNMFRLVVDNALQMESSYG